MIIKTVSYLMINENESINVELIKYRYGLLIWC